MSCIQSEVSYTWKNNLALMNRLEMVLRNGIIYSFLIVSITGTNGLVHFKSDFPSQTTLFSGGKFRNVSSVCV